MNYQAEYEAKRTSAEALAAQVQSGWLIGMDAGAAQTPTIMSAIAERARKDEIAGVKVQTLLDVYPLEYLADNPSASDASLESGNVNPFSGSASEEVNGNQPGFTPEQMKYADYSFYSELDYLHRCGMAFKVIGPDTLQTGDSKEDFGMNDPPGWSQKRYDDIIDVGYLYHRCHLIAHQLGGNEDQKNIMTGTSYLNETGMKPYEEKVANYVRKTGNHVLYRVTPFYKGENLIASGVQIEAYSIEDKGQGVCFNVYCYNVQPGVEINYNTGDNNRADTIYDDPHALPFAVYKADENNPDLILEMNKHLAILFEDHTSSRIYISMMDNIGTVAEKARNIYKRLIIKFGCHDVK